MKIRGGTSLLGLPKANKAIEETAHLDRPSVADSRKKIGFGKWATATCVAFAAEAWQLQDEVTGPAWSEADRISGEHFANFLRSECIRCIAKDEDFAVIAANARVVVRWKAGPNECLAEIWLQGTGRGGCRQAKAEPAFVAISGCSGTVSARSP